MIRKAKKDVLYSLTRTVGDNNMIAFQIYKLDEDFQTLNYYNVSRISEDSWVCTCPAWKSPCKHIVMAKRFLRGEANEPEGLADKGSCSDLPTVATFSLNLGRFIKRQGINSSDKGFD